MVQLPAENSILARTVRRAAGEGRLSHAVIVTGQGDLTAAALFIAAAHVCEGADKPCLRCRHCRKVSDTRQLLSRLIFAGHDLSLDPFHQLRIYRSVSI